MNEHSLIYMTNLYEESMDLNTKLQEEIEKLDNILENIGYQIEGLLYHIDEKSVISKHNGKVLKNILKMIETRNVSIKINDILGSDKE